MEEILLLESQVFKAFDILYDITPWQKQQFSDQRKFKDVLSCVVIEHEKCVGFSIAYEFEPHFAHISRFAISPEYLSKGIGSQLMDYQLAVLSKYSYKSCSVDLIERNQRAIGLYKRKGFMVLTGDDLTTYLDMKKRDHDEYIGKTSTHIAMIKYL
jgi:ribosomal protein S18 acetylase RimI-like enzyme